MQRLPVCRCPPSHWALLRAKRCSRYHARGSQNQLFLRELKNVLQVEGIRLVCVCKRQLLSSQYHRFDPDCRVSCRYISIMPLPPRSSQM